MRSRSWRVVVASLVMGMSAVVPLPIPTVADATTLQPNGQSIRPSISDDGRIIAFESQASNLVAKDTNGAYDIFVRDRSTGVTKRVSIGSSGAQSNGISWEAEASGDGLKVAFQSTATNLVAADTNGLTDVFVRDRSAGVTVRASKGYQGDEANSSSERPSLSFDGRYVAFRSFASNLVVGDTNGHADVFVRDIVAGSTARISVDSAGAQANNSAAVPYISSNGRFVTFDSYATNLVAGDTNGVLDVFLHDRDVDGDGLFDEPGAVSTRRVSLDPDGAQTTEAAYGSSVSADGRVVAFFTTAPLERVCCIGDTNGAFDVYIRDIVAGTTFWASRGQSGGANGNSLFPSLSNDGRYVAFQSLSALTGDTNNTWDVFEVDLLTGPWVFKTRMLSESATHGPTDGKSENPSMAGNGIDVAFESFSTNMRTGGDPDTNQAVDVYIHQFEDDAKTDCCTSRSSEPSKPTPDPAVSGPVHHIASNKHNGGTCGKAWTPIFEGLFTPANMTLGDALNKVTVPGHIGPHPCEYHQIVFDRLSGAVAGLTGDAYRKALRAELRNLARDILDTNHRLNELVRRINC